VKAVRDCDCRPRIRYSNNSISNLKIGNVGHDTGNQKSWSPLLICWRK